MKGFLREALGHFSAVTAFLYRTHPIIRNKKQPSNEVCSGYILILSFKGKRLTSVKGTVDVIFKEAGICVTVGPRFLKVALY